MTKGPGLPSLITTTTGVAATTTTPTHAPVVPDWKVIIKNLEGDLASQLTQQLVSGLVSKVTWIASWGLTPIVGLIVGYIVGLGIKYGDWFAFMVADGWKNSEEGKSYVQAALANAKSPSPENTQAQKDAFDKLMGITH